MTERKNLNSKNYRPGLAVILYGDRGTPCRKGTTLSPETYRRRPDQPHRFCLVAVQEGKNISTREVALTRLALALEEVPNA